MMTFVTSVGIIGFGDFGEFLATKLEPHFEVKVSSRRSEAVPEKWRGTFEDVAQCDYIIPSIPLGTYEQVLSRLEPIVRSNTVLVDICSVKLRPIEIIRNVLPKVRLVATHPLFGPQSAADSLDGHTLVICPEVSDTEATSHISKFAEFVGLKIAYHSADDHDRQMALVHGLTFFIGQGLVDMGLHDVSLKTPSFQSLLKLVELERHNSPDLFRTIQQGNPYANETRQLFMDKLASIQHPVESTD